MTVTTKTMRRATTPRFIALVIIALSVVSTSAIADTGTPPAFKRTLGGSGDAGMYPSGAEIDPSDGSYVVADTGNDRVKKYTSGGTLVWDVGGFGSSTNPLRFNDPRDIGIDSFGNIFVADTGNVRIVKLTGASGAFVSTWKGVGADKMGSPIGVTVSLYDDLVYVADAGKKMVRVYDLSGTQIRAFGQSGTCVFSNIRDVDAGPGGIVYIANYLQKNILKMSSTGSCITKWGSNGSGNGQFKNPYGVRVAYDPSLGDDAVFVADSNNNRIQEFDLNGNFVAKFGTTGTGTAQFAGMRRVAVSSPYSCSLGTNACIDVAGADLWGWKMGIWTTSAGDTYSFDRTLPNPVLPPAGDGGTSLSNPVTSVFNEPRGIAFAPDGSLRIMDTVNQRIIWIDNTGHLPSGAGTWSTCGQRGWTAGAFNWPRGIAVDQTTGDLWVADTKQSRLQVIQSDCTAPVFIGSAGAGSTQFNWPYSIVIRESDRVAFVADTKNHRVKAYDVATRSLLGSYGSLGAGTGQFNQPAGIAVDPNTGNLFVADRNNGRIVQLSYSGGNFSWVGTFASGGTLKQPEGVALDDQGRIFVADSGHNQMVVIQKNSGSVIATVTGLKTPQNVAVDQNGCIYLADTYNDRIQVYSYETTCT